MRIRMTIMKRKLRMKDRMGGMGRERRQDYPQSVGPCAPTVNNVGYVLNSTCTCIRKLSDHSRNYFVVNLLFLLLFVTYRCEAKELRARYYLP